MAETKALLLVTMEPPPSLAEEFDDWYETEHFPQRCALPGFESGGRFICIEGWPRWLALYDLSSQEALATPEYRAVSGANTTPWSRRVLARCAGRMRVVAEQVVPGNALILPRNRISRLAIARFPARAPDWHGVLAANLREALAKIDGMLQVRLFGSQAESGRDLWIIAELGRPGTAAALLGALAEWSRTGPDLFNVYSPYWRG